MTTDTITGTVACSANSSPKVTAPEYKDTYLVPGSTSPYTFAPFTIDVADFPLCGFKEYVVTAVEKGTTNAETITNPHQGETCDSVGKCLTRVFDT